MLLDAPEIYQLESRFINLFERTFKKAIKNTPGPKLKTSLKSSFSSATYSTQLDSILDDLVLFTVEYTDKQIDEVLTASIRRSNSWFKLVASDTSLPLTEEAVKQSVELSELIADSIIEVLKEEAIYKEHPSKLAKRILDLWGGEKHRAVRFARTFSADVATSTSLHRFKSQGIEHCQFLARIDNRTSPQCRAMNGTIFETNSKEAARYSCPLHHHCRSVILPMPNTIELDKKLVFENRDFTKTVDDNFKALETLDPELVKNTFKEIEKFKDKWAIPKFIFDEDIEKRLMKLGVGIEVE